MIPALWYNGANKPRRREQMSKFWSATKYDVNPKSYICTNPECSNSLPHYKGIGKESRKKCPECGAKMQKVWGEPRK